MAECAVEMQRFTPQVLEFAYEVRLLSVPLDSQVEPLHVTKATRVQTILHVRPVRHLVQRYARWVLVFLVAHVPCRQSRRYWASFDRWTIRLTLLTHYASDINSCGLHE